MSGNRANATDDNGYQLTAQGAARFEAAFSKGYREKTDENDVPLRRWTEGALETKAGMTRNTVRAIRHGRKDGKTVRLSNIRSVFHCLGIELEPNDTTPPNAVIPAEERLEPVRRAFLEHLRDDCKGVNPRGVSQTTKTVTLPLDEVYVTLAAERERAGYAERDYLPFDTDDETGEPSDRLHQRRGRLFRQEIATQKVGLPQAARDSSRLILLGAPGSGKTTLTRFLAASFARAALDGAESVTDRDGETYGPTRLPIRVRVAEYADAFRKNRSLTLEEYLPTAFKESRLPPGELAEVFQAAFDGSGALILLDGLDEVAEAGDRRDIAERIDRFVRGLKPQNRVLVTSRIAGYQAARLGGAFETYQLQDMDRTQIERFLRNWCAAVEKFQTPDEKPESWRRKGDIEADALLTAVDNNPGVQRLATNPLLLTVLALIQRNGARMPERRIELYETAAKTLLRDWRLHQAGGEARTVEEWEAEEMLGPLAYWMHENEETGLISEREARAKLCELHGAAQGKPPTDSNIRREVDDFLLRVREHTGLFVERTPGMYGFMHLTFEEYFAARDMVSFLPDAAERIYKHRHDPRWEEPIRLAIALERPKNATHLIRTAIMAQGAEAEAKGLVPSQYDEILRRDLFFAARCIGDCTGIDSNLAQEVAIELTDICLNWNDKGAFQPLRMQAQVTLAVVRSSAVGQEALAILLRAAKHYKLYIRQAAVVALGFLGHDSPEARRILLREAKRKGGSIRVRRASIQALGSVGQQVPEVLEFLLMAVKEKNRGVRRTAVEALISVCKGSSEALNFLLRAARDADSDWSVREAAVIALGSLSQDSPEVLNFLLQAAEGKDENWNLREAAVIALGSMDQGSPETLAVLLRVVKDKDRRVRAEAIIALGYIGQDSLKTLNVFLQALKEKDNYIRRAGIVALEFSGHSTPSVVDALLKIANEKGKSEYIRQVAIKALGSVRQDSPEVIDFLLRVVSNENGGGQRAAIRVLGSIGQSITEVLNLLLQVATSQEPNTRAAAVKALGSVGQGSVETLDILLRAVEDENVNVREAAWTSLWKLVAG